MIDNAAHRRRDIPHEHAPLPAHATGQPGGYYLVNDAGRGLQQRMRIVLSLEKTVNDAGRPDVKARRLVFVLRPRPESGGRPRAGVIVVLAKPPPAFRKNGIARERD